MLAIMPATPVPPSKAAAVRLSHTLFSCFDGIRLSSVMKAALNSCQGLNKYQLLPEVLNYLVVQKVQIDKNWHVS